MICSRPYFSILYLKGHTRYKRQSCIFQSMMHIFQSMLQRFQSVLQKSQSVLQRFQSVRQRFQPMLQRFQPMLQIFQSVLQRFQSVLQRFQSVLQRFQSVLQRFSLLRRFSSGFELCARVLLAPFLSSKDIFFDISSILVLFFVSYNANLFNYTSRSK